MSFSGPPKPRLVISVLIRLREFTRKNPGFVLVGGLLLLVLLSAIWFMRLSPEAREAARFFEEMPAERILEVRISPYTVSSLLERELVIKDRARIAQLAGILRAARRAAPNHPKARWVAGLRLVTAERDYGGTVDATSNDQGVLIFYASQVQGGWNYGTRRADELGPLLEAWAAEAAGNRL